MEARLRFKAETLTQKGTAGKILIWIQDNEPRTRNTNIAVMAKTIEMADIGVNLFSAKSMLQKMINNQMLHRYGGRKRSTFMINYYHKDIPGYILDRAPAEIKERVKRMNDELKPNQHIDTEGCIVTESEKSEPEQSEDTTTQPDLKVETKPTESKPVVEEETLKSSSDASEENTTSVPITISDTERGLSISITLNLNINK